MPNSSNRQPFLTKGDDGPPPRINCEADYRRNLDLEPVGAGPLALAAVYCQGVPPTLLARSPPVVSPDARSIVYCEDAKTLRVARLDGGRILTDYQIELG